MVNPVIEPLATRPPRSTRLASPSRTSAETCAGSERPGPLPRPRGHRARRKRQGLTAGPCSTRSTTSTGSCSSIAPTRGLRDLGAVRATRAATSSSLAITRVSAPAGRVVSAFWLRVAWTRRGAGRGGVLIEADGSIHRHDPTVAAPLPASTAFGPLLSPASRTPTHTRSSAPSADALRTGRGSFWTWRERMYELADALDPDACASSPDACFAEMALAGITTVGEFHYLPPRSRREPLRGSERDGTALIDAARAGPGAVTLLDACYLTAVSAAPPEGRSAGSPTATPTAWAGPSGGPRRLGPGARIGAAIHSVRAVDPDSAGAVAGGLRAASGRFTRTSPSNRPRSKRAGRGLGSLRWRCSPTRAPSASASRRSTRPTSRTRLRLLGRASATAASARPPSAIWPTASAPRGESSTRAPRSPSGPTRTRSSTISRRRARRARPAPRDRRAGPHEAAELLRPPRRDGRRSSDGPRPGGSSRGAMRGPGRDRAGRRQAGGRADATWSPRPCSPRTRPTFVR